MRTIIAGSRRITDLAVVEAAVRASGFEPSVVISGCAPGVDRLGERWARERGIRVDPYPAAWKLHGKRAGPIRNEVMALAAGPGGALIAIPDEESIGTLDMIARAKKHGLRVYVHRVTTGI